ncbi:MAG: hypothetical protein U9R26_05925 [Campylobacterota bacterium]|nr:hypothetical protein [Campylobacterota bacterium]
MENKKIVFTFILSSSILTILFFGVLFLYDPLRLFHKPWLYKEYLQPNMREQAAGIINNWKFDSIIIGTSIIENSSSREASEELGGSFVNISLAGSSFYERAIVLDYAFRKKRIKKVIFSLDSGGLFGTEKGGKGLYALSNWDYLYDENPWNDLKAYMNSKYLKCLFLPRSKRRCMGKKVDFDRPNAWYIHKVHSEKFGGLDNWFKAKDDVQIKAAFSAILETINAIKLGEARIDPSLETNIVKSRKFLDETLLRFVSKYPGTEFILILPPYSRINDAIIAQYHVSAFERWEASVRYLISKSETYKNLKIYGWGNNAFVDDIANYKDLSHYSHTIDSWILGAIKREEGLLTATNIDKYLELFTEKALNYKLFIVGDKIDNYLHPEKH